jgi:molecular chaperone GrpE
MKKTVEDPVEDNSAHAAAPEGNGGGAPPEPGEVDTLAVKDPVTLLAEVSSERDNLLREKEELLDLLQRRQADFENTRRRVEKDRADALEFATMETVAAILPVVDDFERALKTADGQEGTIAEYAKGVELIYQRLLDALKKMGLDAIESLNQPFDPNLHHAVQREPVEGIEEELVLEEYQRGYYFKGRLLRPAMVKVAVRA